MSVSFTRRGYIELFRDGVRISRHTAAEEAYERAVEHAKEYGPGRYTVRYPDREIDVGAFVIRSSIAPTPGGGGSEYNGLTPTIYAAPADVGSGDGSSEANAMDLATALTSATAGAIIGCIPGVYTKSSSGSSVQASWSATNSGTSGSPIKVVAKYQATSLSSVGSNSDRCELRVTGVANDSNPVFGSAGEDYVHWIGFYADESQSTASSGTGVMVLGSGSIGSRLENCVVIGTSTSIVNNHVGLYVNDAISFTVKNCKISGYTSTAPGSNEGGIMLYGARDFLFENIWVDDAKSAVYVKGDVNGMNYGTFRYCYFSNYEFIRCQEINGTSGGVVFEQCVLDSGSHSGVYLTNTGLQKKVTLNNCTVICASAANGGVHGEQNEDEVNIVDSIFYAEGTGVQLINLAGMTNSFQSISNNRYYSTVSWEMYKGSGTPITTLAGWVSASGETGAAEGDPGFLLTGSNAERYKRSSYADGRGAYITGSETVGVAA